MSASADCTTGALSILSFNVHGFADSSIDEIVQMIHKQNADIVVLQEVSTSHGLKTKDIYGYFKKIGYVDYMCASNGDEKRSRFISNFVMILSKKEFKTKECFDLSVTIHNRNCIVVQTSSNITIACVHLEIGKRFHHLREMNSQRLQIETENTDARIRELDILLKKYPKIDIIVGDFNFSPNDPEFEWLQQKNYCFAKDYEKTTKYNRVDMMFVQKSFQMGLPSENLTIDVELSDHKPIYSRWTSSN